MVTFMQRLAGGCALANNRKKFSVVARSISATGRPLDLGQPGGDWATKAGSLRLPRYGTGAR